MKWDLGFSPFNPLKSPKYTQRMEEGGRLVGDRPPSVVFEWWWSLARAVGRDRSRGEGDVEQGKAGGFGYWAEQGGFGVLFVIFVVFNLST